MKCVVALTILIIFGVFVEQNAGENEDFLPFFAHRVQSCVEYQLLLGICQAFPRVFVACASITQQVIACWPPFRVFRWFSVSKYLFSSSSLPPPLGHHASQASYFGGAARDASIRNDGSAHRVRASARHAIWRATSWPRAMVRAFVCRRSSKQIVAAAFCRLRKCAARRLSLGCFRIAHKQLPALALRTPPIQRAVRAQRAATIRRVRPIRRMVPVQRTARVRPPDFGPLNSFSIFG